MSAPVQLKMHQIRTASTPSEAFITAASISEAVEVVTFAVVEVVLRIVIIVLLIYIVVFLRSL